MDERAGHTSECSAAAVGTANFIAHIWADMGLCRSQVARTPGPPTIDRDFQ
jgi:hypothetical protein